MDYMSLIQGGIDSTISSAFGIYDRFKENQRNQQNLDFQNYWNDRNIKSQEETNRLNRVASQNINTQNIYQQQEANAQNERLMRESWGREDTAVQRRAADLRAAGINPILAAGDAAQSGSPIRMEAPTMHQPIPNEAPQGTAPHMDKRSSLMEKYLAIASHAMEFSKSQEQLRMMEEQRQSMQYDNQFKSLSMLDRLMQVTYDKDRARENRDFTKTERLERERRYKYFSENKIYPELRDPISMFINGIMNIKEQYERIKDDKGSGKLFGLWHIPLLSDFWNNLERKFEGGQ